jgi:hypothetical protein
MGAASSNMPALAALGLEVFMYPLIFSMWFNSRCFSGWACALSYLFFWFLIRVGFQIHNPLSTLVTPTDISEGNRIYFGWFPVFMFIAALAGWIVCLLMDIREAIPLYALFPSFNTTSVDLTPCEAQYAEKLKQYDCDCSHGIQRWCFNYVDPPYWHTFVGILLALFTLILPALLFFFLYPNAKWGAFIALIAIKIVGYIVAWAFWTYRTDLYVWGPSEFNTAPRIETAKKNENSVYADDPDLDGIAKILYRRTQWVINKNVLVIGLTDVLGCLLIGGLIVIPSTPDVDIIWITGLIFILAVAVIFSIAGLIYYSRMPKNPCPSTCPLVTQPTCPLGKQKPLNSKKPPPLNTNANELAFGALLQPK